MGKDKDNEYKTIATNRQAGFNYEILEKTEAGLALGGSEVKSLREGRANLADSYVRFKNGEAFIVNLHISPYSHVSFNAPEPERMRKLLLTRPEIARLSVAIERKGFTCIPLRLYFKRSWAKVEIAVCRGKKQFDRRDAIKERMQKREIDRSVKRDARKKF
ncbi:MAG: SsrA-binding protein SmpB [Candidatus Omnitrophica bacterium]|nr:SsrA-binding protein SmpB [Candidatus Omnitrophota bacterium]